MLIKSFRTVFVLMFVIALTTACQLIPPGETGGGDQTTSPGGTLQGETPTQMPLCTPPPCAPDEAYFCPDECPDGCGTVCATHTPTPLADQSPATETEGSPPLPVQSFPDPSLYSWQLVASGLNKPLGLTHAGDDSGRLFILEQPGLIWVHQNGERLPTPFLDVRDRVFDQGNEQGLLGLAFHPAYEQNGTFFINYTGQGGDTVISRLQVSGDPNVGDAGTEKVLLRIEQPFSNHNGGHLVFGPDGYLFIGTGDGGSGGDPQGNAQNLNSLLGKLLRIDVDHGEPYAIPGDNPYLQGGGRPEIWASGLRNPWRFTFDRVTGDLYIGDVGQNQWEEVSILTAGHPGGANFGWNVWEASHPFQGGPQEGVQMVSTIWEYDHTQGCSITGGFLYRGSLADWSGIYVYGDFCTGTIWGLLQDAQGAWQNMLLFQTKANITSFGEDEAGELYLVDRNGSVYQLVRVP
ncbi:MAG: PQQ-dependent sugar dehydrogenase [Anaerolineales bacterium]|nr:PQQ-dependent sugar dehydrogenase [Anaerolineales bacterium]